MYRRPSLSPLPWIFGATAASWIVLALDLPWLQALPGWFWPLTDAPRPQPAWIAAALVMFGVIAWWISRPGRRRVATVSLLLVLGVALQWCFALTEGRGHQALRDRMIVSGHAALLHEAVARNEAHDDLWRVARGYPSRVESGELPAYPFATKPVGALFVYMLHERLTALVPNRHGDREARAVTAATLVFPLLASAVALPLLALASAWRRRATSPALLYLTVPAVLLITLHLDQALFPLLAAAVYWLCVASVDAGVWRRPASALAAGAIAGLSCFTSYAFVAVVAFGALVLALRLRGRKGWQRMAAYGGGVLAGLGTLYAAFGFDLLRGLDAVSRHRQWKIDHWDPATTLSVGLVDLVELAVWTGPPVFMLASLGCVQGARHLVGRRSDPHGELSAMDAVGVALALVVLLLAFTGRTVGEVARLWLFLQPAIALVAARELDRRVVPLPETTARIAWLSVAAVQLLHTAALKLWMDFV